MKLSHLKTPILAFLFISVAVLLSCNKDEGANPDQEVEVNFTISNLSLFTSSSELRSTSLPIDFVHNLGGDGTLQLTSIDGSIDIEMAVSGDNLFNTSFSLPVGTYDISFEVSSDLSCGLSRYFPFIASAQSILVDENTTSIDLVGSTDHDVVVVRDQNLCGGAPARWSSSITGCELNFTRIGNYYMLYINEQATSWEGGTSRLLIQYTIPNTTECANIYATPTHIGSHAHIYSVVISADNPVTADVYSIFTSEEIEIGIGGS